MHVALALAVPVLLATGFGLGRATAPDAGLRTTAPAAVTAALPAADAAVQPPVDAPAAPVAAAPAEPVSAPAPAEPAAPVASSHTLTGTFDVVANRNPKYPDNCRGFEQNGQGDLRVGSSVTVRDGQGGIVGVGALEDCEYTGIESPGQARGLRFTFTVAGVAAADFYTVEVEHRGQVPFSRADLESRGWAVQLSL